MSEEDLLLLKAAEGSTAAFEAIYDRFSPLVYGLAKRVVRSESLAEDVAHDALLGVWSTSAAFDPARGTARAWIMTLAHGRAVDAVRREQAHRDRVNAVGAGSTYPEYDVVSEGALQNMVVARVQRALGMLTPLQRGAVQLAYFGGFTHTEIAELLDLPLGTAKLRINSALRRLRRELTGDGAAMS